MSNNQEIVANLIAEAKEYRRNRQYEQALEACNHAIEADPNALRAYRFRWDTIRAMMTPDEARPKIIAEIEAFLDAHPETPEVLKAAYWSYMDLPGRRKNVPQSLFDRMLQYDSSTNVCLIALLGLAGRSEYPREKWEYYRRVIDEFVSATDFQEYCDAYRRMLELAKKDSSLASEKYIDELIDRFLQAHLDYRQHSKRWPGWAYIEAAEYRITFGIRVDRALELLDLAEAVLQEILQEMEEQDREALQKYYKLLRGEACMKLERWKEAYEALKAATYSDYLTTLWFRYNEGLIRVFFLLGRALEGLGELNQAQRYYTDAHFAPNPYPEARVGLERIYQAQHGSLNGFADFLKTLEAEYRQREAEEHEIIRQNLIKAKLDKEAPDFTLKNLDGETFTLSEMRGRVVLFEVWEDWCGVCIEAIPEIEKVCEHFRTADDVVIWGINNGQHPERVRAFLEEHQQPWTILPNLHGEVSKAYQLEGVPNYVLIDKAGRWQYTWEGYGEGIGQEMIWLIEDLRMID